MSGRKPPLYCTLTLITMQGHQNRRSKRHDEPGYSSILVYWVWNRIGINTTILPYLFVKTTEWNNVQQTGRQQVKLFVGSGNMYGHTHIAGVWINRVRLPILHVVSWTGKMNIFGLARRVRQFRPSSACSSPYSGWIWCILTGFLPSSAAASIDLFKPPYAIGPVPSLSGQAIAYRWRSLPRVRQHRASKPQGSSERVLPWQVTMDQLICVSLSHTHYWHEVVIACWKYRRCESIRIFFVVFTVLYSIVYSIYGI